MSKNQIVESTSEVVESNTNSIPKIELPTNLNVSGTIRYLSGSGLTRGQIVKYFREHLGREIRYQHVRNVLITPLKKD